MLPTETHFSSQHIEVQSEEMEEDIPCNWKSKKKARVAILISEKINFKRCLNKRQRRL